MPKNSSDNSSHQGTKSSSGSSISSSSGSSSSSSSGSLGKLPNPEILSGSEELEPLETIPNGAAKLATPNGEDCLTEEEVFENEFNLLLERRKRVGLAPEDERDENAVKDTLIGLALSGGGVRSGAYSLGIIQGLWKKGILPAVDFLSTVSGGGYAGAFLTSHGLSRKQRRVDDVTRDQLQEEGLFNEFAIAPGLGGRNSIRTGQFVHSGNYLFNSTMQFLNRHLVGLLLIWTLCISGLCALASLLAFSYRSLDWEMSRSWLSALGFDGEVKMAFFPSFVLFLIWMLCWMSSFIVYRRRARGTMARYTLYLLLVSLAAAVAVLMGAGDIYLASANDIFGLAPGKGDVVLKWAHRLSVFLIPAIFAALIPYLSPKTLLKSGTSPTASTAEKYTFRFATRALVYGVPFLVMVLF